MSGREGEMRTTPGVKLTYDDFLLFPDDEAFAAPFDVLFSDFDVVEPDLLYISNARSDEILTTKHVRGAPNLVVEIGSPGTRKRDETLALERNDTLGTSLLPGLQAPLSRIFKD